MKICIAQYYTSNLTHGPFAEDINRAYAQKNGYDYYVEKDDEKINETLFFDEHGWKSNVKLHPTWYKPFLILEIFDKIKPDYVLFLDTDAIVSGTSKKIEDYIDKDSNLIASQDVSEHSVFNAGVFIIKNCDWSKNLLRKWIGLSRSLKPTQIKNLSFADSEKDNNFFFTNNLWMDQSGLTYMYENIEGVKEKVYVHPPHFLNASHYCDNDETFIHHAYCFGQEPHRGLDKIHAQLFDKTEPAIEESSFTQKNVLDRLEKIEANLKELNLNTASFKNDEKVALVCCLFFDSHYNKDLVRQYNSCLDFLFPSAKEFFLSNHNVEFIIITNSEFIDTNHNYVNLVRVDHEIRNNWHGYSMKVLGLDYIPNKGGYSHIFSTDVDQMFINQVTSEDLLSNDFLLMRHWNKPDFATLLKQFTNFIDTTITEGEAEWTLGNFFGGKTNLVLDMLEKSKEIHSELFDSSLMEGINFYSRYPEELFVAKYVHENKLDYKYLSSVMDFQNHQEEKIFLGDFEQFYRNYKPCEDYSKLAEFKNVQCVHQTKICFPGTFGGRDASDLEFIENFARLYFNK